jgi:hypothetical protein
MLCISNRLSDFVKPPKESDVPVKGFNGTISSTKVSTMIWAILDDSDHERTLALCSWEDSRYSKGERTMKVKVKSCC